MRLDVGTNVAGEVLSELVPTTFTRALSGRARAEGPGVTGRHDDDHRFGLLGRDEVVEDEAGTSNGRPRIVAVEGAVEEVEDGELAFPRFVARRRVDVHAAEPLKRLRIVGHFGHGAARHVPGVEEFRARNVNKAPRVGVRLARDRVLRIHDGDAVDVESIAVGAGRDGAHGPLPNALVVLGQAGVASQVGNITGVEPNRFGLGGEDAKDDLSIGFHFGRSKLGRPGAVFLGGKGRGKESNRCQDGQQVETGSWKHHREPTGETDHRANPFLRTRFKRRPCGCRNERSTR